MPRSSARPFGLAFAVVLALSFCVRAVRAADPPLPAYNAAIGQTSISGISSGAYMAVQFATAWSSIIVGVGAVAGGPYGCAEGSAATALSTCMLGTPDIDLNALFRRTDAWGRSGAIDATSRIAHQRVYLFSGYNDAVVARRVTGTLQAFYAHYLKAAHLFYQTAIGAGHAQVTADYGEACAATGGVHINDCNYDQAGVILQHIYGALHAPQSGPPSGHVLRFSQADYTRPFSPAQDSMAATGYVYVPQACAAGEACRVHVALHGCKQSSTWIGETFVRHAGYNAWADTNHIIVLYPQTRAELFTVTGGSNPNGCWDWWGYLDADPMDTPTYLLKSGRQIRAIRAMIDRLTSGAAPPAPAAAAPLPGPPAVVYAADASDSAIDLVWSAVPGAERYEVFRADPGDAAFHQIGSVEGLSYADSNLQAATLYRYRVRVSGSPQPGPASAVVSQATRAAVPRCDDPGRCPVR